MGDVKLITQLARTIMQAFYTDEHAVVMEFLLCDKYYLVDGPAQHTSLSNQVKGNAHPKKVRQILNELKEHNLVQVISFRGTDGTETRYWYVDYQHFIKITKLYLRTCFDRIEEMESSTTASAASLTGDQAAAQIDDYQCPHCSRRYSSSEVMRLSQYPPFTCGDCETILVTVEELVRGLNGASSSTSNGAQSSSSSSLLSERMKAQVEADPRRPDVRVSIRGLLNQLDAQARANLLPENNPVKRIQLEQHHMERATTAATMTEEEEEEMRRRTNGGATSTTTTSTINTGKSQDMSYEQSQRARLGEEPTQASLPWMMKSSVTGEETKAATSSSSSAPAQSSTLGAPTQASHQQSGSKVDLDEAERRLSAFYSKDEGDAATSPPPLKQEDGNASHAASSAYPSFSFQGLTLRLDLITKEHRATMDDEEFEKYKELCDSVGYEPHADS